MKKRFSAGGKQTSQHVVPPGEPVQFIGGVPAERRLSGNYSHKHHKAIAYNRAKAKTEFGDKDL
jgi:hypothetical protein